MKNRYVSFVLKVDVSRLTFLQYYRASLLGSILGVWLIDDIPAVSIKNDNFDASDGCPHHWWVGNRWEETTFLSLVTEATCGIERDSDVVPGEVFHYQPRPIGTITREVVHLDSHLDRTVLSGYVPLARNVDPLLVGEPIQVSGQGTYRPRVEQDNVNHTPYLPELPSAIIAGEIGHHGHRERPIDGYYRVKIRRDIGPVRPDAECLDGNVYRFEAQWALEDDGHAAYRGRGEWAMGRSYPQPEWPREAPVWLSSGDLEFVSVERPPLTLVK